MSDTASQEAPALAPAQIFLNGKVELRPGDCRDVIRAMPDNSIDSVVCDPPYALVSIVKRFGGENAKPANGGDVYARASAGFMGKAWDTGEVAFADTFWREVLRVLKPGGHVVAFSGTRTYHRMAAAIEDAGFEIRDQLGWLYGSGFPKSHNQHGDWEGWGTALKPAWEPIALARKPLTGTVAANLAEWGVGAINVDGCRVATDDVWAPSTRGASDSIGTFKTGERTTEQNNLGSWPANIVHDGSDEVVAAFPDSAGAQGVVRGTEGSETGQNGIYGRFARVASVPLRNDSGSAARFFYTAKADKLDRIGSKHPTVKPVDLMQWLCRMVTPPGGLVLDPFAGSGSTGEAAWREGMRCILIEREAEYQADIAERLRLADKGPATRKARAIKQVANDNLPLFKEVA